MLTLRQPAQYDTTLFTKGEGTLPIFSHSTYCAKCFTRYHPNFCVNKQASTQTYYKGVPDVIQVSQRSYFKTAVLELQANQMCFRWESSANCVRTYNQALRVPDAHRANNVTAFGDDQWAAVPLPLSWGASLIMSGANVLDGFYLYSLLLDKAEHKQRLVLPHDATLQKLRLELLIAEWNATMEGFGKESYAHAYDVCCHIYEDEDVHLVKLQGVVSDGSTIGHPCCTIHDCQVPLANSSWNIYCPAHLGYEAKCAVTVLPTHRGLTQDLGPSAEEPDDEAVILEGEDGPGARGEVDWLDCEETPVQGNRRLRVQFGQRHMHNEQLIIRPCGVIVLRGTFFGSEVISAIRDFMLATFPTPDNCSLLKHCRKIGCHRFDNMAVVVDVFHFTRKHKESDGFCQEHCNPTMFPERYSNGKWMSVVHFNFFLDEMIKQRNRYTIVELERKGHRLWVITVDTLFAGGVPGQSIEL
ncbi:hypothetical protein K439DRAFT_1647814 [Ramaria rubella]|nr:hypothetical protein K439DRAFT_1647814 [Ramaria rubella]